MSITKRPNTKYYYSEFTLDGKKYIKSTKTTDRKLASKIDQQYYQETLENSKLGGKAILLKDAFTAYLDSLEETSYKKLTKGLVGWFNTNMDTNIKMTKVDTQFLYNFVKLRSIDSKQSTVKMNLGFIKRVVKHTKKLGYDTCDCEAPEIKVKNSKTRTLSTEEQERLLHEFKNPDTRQGLGPKVKRDLAEWYGVCLCLFGTGCRVSEILEIKWDQVDLENKLFYIWRKKTSSNSVLPMSERVYQYLLTKERTHEYVFPNPALTGPRRYSSSTFKSACERAGIEDVTFHKIRHTVITNYCKAGLSLPQVMTMSGHSSVNSLMRYNHLTSADVIDKAREIINS